MPREAGAQPEPWLKMYELDRPGISLHWGHPTVQPPSKHMPIINAGININSKNRFRAILKKIKFFTKIISYLLFSKGEYTINRVVLVLSNYIRQIAWRKGHKIIFLAWNAIS
jgi:hypothetical protein